MSGNLYEGKILEAAATIPEATRLQNPDATATKVSRVCGSELTLDLKFEEDRVSAFGLEAKACALGQAAASLTVRNLIGANAKELYLLHDEMMAMLKEKAPAPRGERWQALKALEGIRDYPQRHASTLLIFKAILDCLEQVGFQKE